MANSYGTNPIYLDTFAAALNLGELLFNDPNALFYVQAIEWQNPITQNHTATITTNAGIPVFDEKVDAAVPEHHFNEFSGVAFRGLKLGAGAVDSGAIAIFLV